VVVAGLHHDVGPHPLRSRSGERSSRASTACSKQWPVFRESTCAFRKIFMLRSWSTEHDEP
jgi:hypothetical protein